MIDFSDEIQELENKLDELFPKAAANDRSAALLLFGLSRRIIHLQRQEAQRLILNLEQRVKELEDVKTGGGH